jgi:polyferredoxin
MVVVMMRFRRLENWAEELALILAVCPSGTPQPGESYRGACVGCSACVGAAATDGLKTFPSNTP